jgi:hypothetical protein
MSKPLRSRLGHIWFGSMWILAIYTMGSAWSWTRMLIGTLLLVLLGVLNEALGKLFFHWPEDYVDFVAFFMGICLGTGWLILFGRMPL